MGERLPVRLNLGRKAWARLRVAYADQPVPLAVDLQARFTGLWLSTLERIVHGLSKPPVDRPEVIFVIGHWRSGTTFLHEMLCADPRVTYPTTYACMNPQVFPVTEAAVLQRTGGRSVARPMDDMVVSLASPQEDEFALLALGAPSPYEGLLFPKALNRAIARADPNDLAAEDTQEWVRVFTRFLGHVAARSPGSSVILKSPTHSYRVALLSALFSNARFIHIVRHPFDVYGSTVKMWTTLCSRYGLTDLPDEGALAAQVMANWGLLEDKLDAALPGLPGRQYVQVRYERLAARPLAEMERIYAELGLASFATALPHLERYLTTHVHAGKARRDRAPENAHAILVAWRRIFDKYGYSATTSPV